MDEAQRLSITTSNEHQSGSELYEDTHVHQVYEQISQKIPRRLPLALTWAVATASILTVNPKISIVTSDRSTANTALIHQSSPTN